MTKLDFFLLLEIFISMKKSSFCAYFLYYQFSLFNFMFFPSSTQTSAHHLFTSSVFTINEKWCVCVWTHSCVCICSQSFPFIIDDRIFLSNVLLTDCAFWFLKNCHEKRAQLATVYHLSPCEHHHLKILSLHSLFRPVRSHTL